MKDFAIVTLVLAIGLLSASCQMPSKQLEVDVAILNLSSSDIEDVKAKFGATACSWGFVGRTFKAINGLYPHPITATAELRWMVGTVEKSQVIDLGGAFPAGRNGELLFTVFDDRAEATFREF